MTSTTTDRQTTPRRPADTGCILITGASGYIGGRMIAAARLAGLEVVAAVRSPERFSTSAGVHVRRFDLTRPEKLDGLCENVDAVVHLAAIIAEDSFPEGASEDLNVSGTRRLLEASRRHGVRRFVFLSTQSAAADSPTHYGRSKWQIEQLLTAEGEISVRTGMVCGGPPRGLYGLLFRLSKRFPVLPVVRPDAPVYPIHVDDLCNGLLALARARQTPPRLTRLAAPSSTAFGDYVRLLASKRVGRRIRLVSIPAALILGLSRLTEAIPFLPRVSSERVMGLIALRPMDPHPGLPDVDVGGGLRDAIEALEAEGLRRRLLAEGRVLMSYILGRAVPGGAQRRYVRAVLAENDAEPLELSRLVQAWPGMLRVLEPLGRSGAETFRRRLSLATRIVEMTPEAAPVFHNYRERSLPIVVLAIVWSLAVETLLMPARLLAGRFKTRR